MQFQLNFEFHFRAPHVWRSNELLTNLGQNKMATVLLATYSNQKFCISIQISLKFVHEGPINIKPTLAQIMDWLVPKRRQTIIGNNHNGLICQHCFMWWFGIELRPYPDSKVHGANMGPTWVLSAPDGPHVGHMNLAIRAIARCKSAFQPIT